MGERADVEADPKMTEAAVLLGIRDLRAAYGKVEILHGVSLDVRRGMLTCIIGPNGAGKSTVLKSVLGQLRVTAGTIRFGGREIRGRATHQIVRDGIGVVPQGRIVFSEMTVDENLDMGGYTVADAAALRRARERVFDLFPRLAERRGQRAGTLSGGEQQMLAMGRALMTDPALVLMDEPSLGLSPLFVDMIFEKIGELKRSGMTILMVEQNAARALAASDHGYVLDLGENRFDGPGRDLLANPEVKRLYLGGH